MNNSISTCAGSWRPPFLDLGPAYSGDIQEEGQPLCVPQPTRQSFFAQSGETPESVLTADFSDRDLPILPSSPSPSPSCEVKNTPPPDPEQKFKSPSPSKSPDGNVSNAAKEIINHRAKQEMAKRKASHTREKSPSSRTRQPSPLAGRISLPKPISQAARVSSAPDPQARYSVTGLLIPSRFPHFPPIGGISPIKLTSQTTTQSGAPNFHTRHSITGVPVQGGTPYFPTKN